MALEMSCPSIVSLLLKATLVSHCSIVVSAVSSWVGMMHIAHESACGLGDVVVLLSLLLSKYSVLAIQGHYCISLLDCCIDCL